jgi:glycine dehydrogenase subunit 1
MDYIPTTSFDQQEMLQRIGLKSISEITRNYVPVYNKPMCLPKPLSEQDLLEHLIEISKMNTVRKYFVGAGCYHHYIPAAIGQLIERGEFLTGYTPYQAEASQGVLQAIYEYQSYICILTGMDIANASLYDGPSALAEAVMLASSYNGRKNIVVGEGIHPAYLEVISTYCGARNLIVKRLEASRVSNKALTHDESDQTRLAQIVNKETACVVVQNPDFYGNVRDLANSAAAAHESGALFIVSVLEPTSLAVIKPPGQYGADIVVGEGQSFGIPMCFGGPSLGFLAAKSFLLKKIPGRICGLTTDSNGKRGFVLTLQAREQHIRRERATSNITTNVALMALTSTIYLALMGRTGLINIAQTSMRRSHLLRKYLLDLGFINLNSNNFYNEFTLKVPTLHLSKASVSPTKLVRRILTKLSKNDIAGGLVLNNGTMIVCCTEMNGEEDIERYASVVKSVLPG